MRLSGGRIEGGHVATVGFVLLHVGGETALAGEAGESSDDRRTLARDILVAVAYTALVLALVSVGLIAFPDGLLP